MDEAVGGRMQSKLRMTAAQIVSERLPGWEAFFDRDPDAKKYTTTQEDRVDAAMRDEDEVRLEGALGSWLKAWRRVNEIIAEEYRAANEDPELWELRYIKWMKIVYIKFDSPMGEFYLVPRRPKKKPKAEHWYTADEMIDMLHPSVAATIQTFKQLPVRPSSLEGPRPEEKHMHVDLTGSEMEVKFEMPKRGRRRG